MLIVYALTCEINDHFQIVTKVAIKNNMNDHKYYGSLYLLYDSTLYVYYNCMLINLTSI